MKIKINTKEKDKNIHNTIMKSLTNYIKESVETDESNAVQTSCDVTFDFTSIENGEDTVKSLQEIGTKEAIPVSVDGATKVTISFSNDTLDKADNIIDVLQQAVEVASKSPKRSSDEQYAQKCQKLKKSMQKVYDFMDECDNVGTSVETAADNAAGKNTNPDNENNKDDDNKDNENNDKK